MNPKRILLTLLLISPLLLSAQTTLISAESKGVLSKTLLDIFLPTVAPDVAPLVKYDVELYRVQYQTVGVSGNLETASGLFVVPSIDADEVVPMLVYQHGTVASRESVPSRTEAATLLSGQGEGLIVVILASMGYASVAPDYLGLGDNPGNHPYVHAATEGSAAFDLLIALEEWAETNTYNVTNKVFVTGYSQGGHGAAAAHKMMEEESSGRFEVAAGSFMSGPYSISEVMRDLMVGTEVYGYTSYVPNTIIGYNAVYQLYDDLESILKQPYADLSQQFADELIDLGRLNSLLEDSLSANGGEILARRMLQDSVITILETAADHPIYNALLDNDLDSWVPDAPVRLVYCEGDDQVPFRNALVAEDRMNQAGAADVLAVQMDTVTSLIHTECVIPAVSYTADWFEGIRATVSLRPPVLVEQLSMSPNPAGQWTTLRQIKAGSQIRVVDMQGRLKQTQVAMSSVVDLAVDHPPKGIYTVSVDSPRGIKSGRLVGH